MTKQEAIGVKPWKSRVDVPNWTQQFPKCPVCGSYMHRSFSGLTVCPNVDGRKHRKQKQ